LAVFPTNSTTSSVAGIVAPSEVADLLPEPEVAFVEPGSREVYQQVLDYYLQQSREQARAGAEIVVWQEYAVYVFEDDEALFIEQGRELARQENIYLLMGLVVGNENVPDEPVDNKVVWIDPDGKIVWEYTKSFPVPGSIDKTGDGQVPAGDTPYGRIATVICYDMDQPLFIRQAGRDETDIMLAPAYDWKGLESVHTPMASFRAVENGFSMVRVTGDGVSAAYDYQGRILAMTNSFTSPGEVMVAHVPTQGTMTIYSVVGDLFAWLCVAGFVVIVGWAVAQRATSRPTSR
ncbi:MAG: nitrilase-related carbon-nitrogen hydrolase, partial [Chloroflexota bacterium]|nr:nitrilase-related carbon-nitrogen hydrolase [Chloroflexota bacterium]